MKLFAPSLRLVLLLALILAYGMSGCGARPPSSTPTPTQVLPMHLTLMAITPSAPVATEIILTQAPPTSRAATSAPPTPVPASPTPDIAALQTIAARPLHSPTPTLPPSATPTPGAPPASPTPQPNCTPGLFYISDQTLPDGSLVSPGQELDKRWSVLNSGTCDWTAAYTLRLIEGDALGVEEKQALYPARSGVQVMVRIVFTAPTTPGEYRSAWQAFDPQGQPFGDLIYIDVQVAGPGG